MPFPSDRPRSPRGDFASRSGSSRPSYNRGSSRPSFRGGPKPAGSYVGRERSLPPKPVVRPELRSEAFAALGVPDALLDALVTAGIETPFPVQTATLPDALAGRDVLGRAPTGSGKTLAYGLALLARTPRAAPKAPRALILVPTRELAKQVAEVLVPFSQATDRWVTAFFGGAGLHRQIDDLQRGVDVAVATPGRLIDLVNRGDARLDEVEFVVIDEADRMADMGFTPQVRELLDQVNAKRQILFFSATLDGDVDDLSKAYLKDPVVHEIDGVDSDDSDDASRRAQHVVVCTKHDSKFQDLAGLLGGVDRALVFVKNRFATERVADALDSLGVRAFAMHGGMTQNARESALKRWAQGGAVALVATDVAARGVHVAGVEVVVHLDPPQEEKDYIHRSGRTARAGATGLVVNLFRKEQLRPAAAMHRRLGVEALTIELKTAKELLATLASDRLAKQAQPLEGGVLVPTARETWTTAELSEVDPDLAGSHDARRPAYGGRDSGGGRGGRPDFRGPDRGARHDSGRFDTRSADSRGNRFEERPQRDAYRGERPARDGVAPERGFVRSGPDRFGQSRPAWQSDRPEQQGRREDGRSSGPSNWGRQNDGPVRSDAQRDRPWSGGSAGRDSAAPRRFENSGTRRDARPDFAGGAGGASRPFDRDGRSARPGPTGGWRENNHNTNSDQPRGNDWRAAPRADAGPRPARWDDRGTQASPRPYRSDRDAPRGARTTDSSRHPGAWSTPTGRPGSDAWSAKPRAAGTIRSDDRTPRTVSARPAWKSSPSGLSEMQPRR